MKENYNYYLCVFIKDIFVSDGDLQNFLNNMSQQQLMQLFGGVGQIGGLSSLLGTMRLLVFKFEILFMEVEFLL